MPLARWLALVGVACSILVASFAVLSSTSTPARAASSLASTTGVGLTAVQSVGKLGAAMVQNGLQPMAVELEQSLLRMAAARDPSWLAVCDGFMHSTRDECRWHRLADRPTWSAGLARTRGRQTDGDGQLQVNLMAAALFLFSESVLAAARNDFAAVTVINGTAQQTTDPLTLVTTAASSSCAVEAAASGVGSCTAELLNCVALADWWELRGLAMAAVYRALRERPDLQPRDLRFSTGRTRSLESQSSFAPLHWERKSNASGRQREGPGQDLR